MLLCVIDIFSKCAWGVPLKDKKDIIITEAFQKVLDESGGKLSKIWVDKGSEFYSKSLKSWLQISNIEIHSTHNEGKSVPERCIRILGTLKNKTCKYMAQIQKTY